MTAQPRPRPEWFSRADAAAHDARLRNELHHIGERLAGRMLLALLDLHAVWPGSSPLPDPRGGATCQTCHVMYPCMTRRWIAAMLAGHEPPTS